MRFSGIVALVGLGALFSIVTAGDHTPGRAPSYRVLLVGDSWAEHLWDSRALRTVFAENGHADVLEKGDLTAIGGTTAAEWKTAPFLLLLEEELDDNPTIDMVHVSLGGNDLLVGQSGGGWHTGLSDSEEQELFEDIRENVATVVQHCLDQRPNIEVLLTAYDYPNLSETLNGSFFCVALWLNAGNPTTAQMNQALIGLDAELAAYAATTDRVTYVSTLGLMQYWYGYPSLNIDPFVIMPPGDPSSPSPPEAMDDEGNDCIHLSDQGYYYMALSCYDAYYQAALGPLPQVPTGFVVR